MQGFEKLLSHTNEKKVFSAKISEYLERYAVHSLIDIGAGDGSLAAMISQKVEKYLAIEPKSKYVAQLRAGGLETIEGTFPVPVKDTYDLVLMSHVVSYNRGNHGVLIPAAWELVKPGGHLLVVTHGNSLEDDWEKLLAHIGFGELEKFAITFNDIVTFMATYGDPEIQKVETTLETAGALDMIEALAFLASGSDVNRFARFMSESTTITRYLEENYRKNDGFSFPFQHLFVSMQKAAR